MKTDAKLMAEEIRATGARLASLLDDADDILQSEEMPEPWEQWDDAVYRTQCAANDLRDGSLLGPTLRALLKAASL